MGKSDGFICISVKNFSIVEPFSNLDISKSSVISAKFLEEHLIDRKARFSGTVASEKGLTTVECESDNGLGLPFLIP